MCISGFSRSIKEFYQKGVVRIPGPPGDAHAIPRYGQLQTGPKVTSLVASSSRGRYAQHLHDVYASYMHIVRESCARFPPDAHVTSANPTQMLRAPNGPASPGLPFSQELSAHDTRAGGGRI
jgi:hypothetical protein